MAFEGLICPACSNPLDETILEENMICPHCNTKLKQKKFLAFLEYLMMQGLVTNIDFLITRFMVMKLKLLRKKKNKKTKNSIH